MKFISSLSFLLCSMVPLQSFAQNVQLDYLSGPIQYQPDDPWVRGRIFQLHTGRAGWFYNCDHQEDKRFSPYINWNQQPSHCYPACPIRADIQQQICKVKRRISWGQGNCYHKTDRVPPNPMYATPYVEHHERHDESIHVQHTDQEYYSGAANEPTSSNRGRTSSVLSNQIQSPRKAAIASDRLYDGELRR